MRLLGVVAGTELGGTEVQAAQRYTAYVQRGIEVDLLLVGKHGPLSKRYRACGVNLFDHRPLFAGSVARLATGSYSVVETYGRRASWSTRLLAPLISRRATVISLNTSPAISRSFLGRRIERWTGRLATLYVSNSTAGRDAQIGRASCRERV